jgi:MscS family membrane protein
MPDTETAPAPELAELAIDPIHENLPTIVEWLPDAVVPYWALVADYPVIGALLIAAASLLLALFVRLAIFRSLRKLAAGTASGIDDDLLYALQKPAFTTVLYFGLTLAVVAAQLPSGTPILVNLLVSVIVASWMRAALRVSNSILRVMENQSKFSLIEKRTVPIFDLTAKLGTILIGSYVLLLVWGINPIGWLASAGIVGIAVGFAAKDTLANLFSGFFIVVDAPYKIGDYINLDTGERGKVSAIGLRSTRLLTRDDVEVTIPNGVIANAKIVNESGGPYLKIRSRISVGVAYGSDVDQVCEVLGTIGNAHPETCSHPAPRVRMTAFGASSLDFDLLVWIERPEDRGRIRHELLMEIYKTLNKLGIEIPFPKHDVYIKEQPRPGDGA